MTVYSELLSNGKYEVRRSFEKGSLKGGYMLNQKIVNLNRKK